MEVKKFLQVVLIRFMKIMLSINQFGDFRSMPVEEVKGHLKKTHEERLRGYGEREEGLSLFFMHIEWVS